MKYLNVTSVTVVKDGKYPSDTKMVHFAHEGEIQRIIVPNVPLIIQHIEWMSDSDLLEHLIDIKPTVYHNGVAIDRLTRIRDWLSENSSIMGTLGTVKSTQVLRGMVSDEDSEDKHVVKKAIDGYIATGVLTIPSPQVFITWMFTDPKYAVAFKLRWGGDENL